MKLHLFSILFSLTTLSAAPLLQKQSLKEACVVLLELSGRVSIKKELPKKWGIAKKLERWSKVIESIERATTYTIHSCIQEAERYAVRVLIDEQVPRSSGCVWELFMPSGSIVLDEEACKTILVAKPVVLVTYKKNAFYVDGKRMKGSVIHVIPEDGAVTFKETTYHGEFLFMPYKDRMICVNKVELESYVGSVLHSESWPGWPLEVNKVFAVMCRSYVLSHMISAEKAGRPYHVRNTNAHQNYHGVFTNTIIEEAVAQTTGLCMVYNNKPVLAMFDACCGGVIPGHIAHGIDFEKEPYLARSYACTYCKKYKHYSWEKTITMAQLEKYLHDARLCSDPVYEVRVVSRDKAGLAKTVHIKTKRGVVTCKGKQIYSAIPDVKSYAFDIAKQGKNMIKISGYGHGHHLGVCQWGAREMVRLGYSYQQILSFYYPGTQLCSMG